MNWDLEENEIPSNHSSVTLSSKASKRSFDEVDSVDDGEHTDGTLSPTSPGSHLSVMVCTCILIHITGQKRSRTR